MQEDEDEEPSETAQKYQCMPSLVSLALMRNRLHMAYLGRKLMKMTAMATGREIRRVCAQMQLAYEHYSDDMTNAFILLARARYFYPNLNKMVLENVGTSASVTVTNNYKTFTGVRVYQFEILEKGPEPYEHLGIEKGGQQIHEVKVHWLELLKSLVLLLDLKTSFQLLDAANKSATKRGKVLSKVIVPRTKSTISFILLELEEMAREGLYRIKMIQKTKERRKLAEKQDDIIEPCICESTTLRESISSELPEECCRKESISSELPEECCGQDHLEVIKKLLSKIIHEGKQMIQSGTNCVNVNKFLLNCNKTKDQIDSLFKEGGATELVDPNLKDRLQHLISHLSEVIDLTNQLKNEVCQTCNESTKEVSGDDKIPQPKDENIERLGHLKKHIKDVMDLTLDYKAQGLSIPSVERFIKTCEVTQTKIDNHIRGPKENEKKLDHLKGHVDVLIKISNDVKKEGMNSSSFDNFLQTCKELEQNLKDYKKQMKQPSTQKSGDLDKLLLSHINETINLSKSAVDAGLAPGGVGEFIKNCEDIKQQFEKKKVRDEDIPKSPVLNELKTNIDCLINLINDLKSKKLATESIEDFLKSCELAKQRIDKMDDQNTDSVNKTDLRSCCASATDPKVCPKCKKISKGEMDKTDLKICEECKKLSQGKVKKIVTVLRRANADGTVSEETKTVIIETKNLNSNHKNDNKNQYVTLCTSVNQNKLGVRETKSEEAMCSRTKYFAVGGSTSASLLTEIFTSDNISNVECETTLHLLEVKSSTSVCDCN